MKFTKMHGLGNDYVYVNIFDQPAPSHPARLAIDVSDRHFGIGSDGLILIGPSRVADAKMQMFNADGSPSEMCGNGVRCVAKYVYDHGIATRPRVTIETGRGVLARSGCGQRQGPPGSRRHGLADPPGVRHPDQASRRSADQRHDDDPGPRP